MHNSESCRVRQANNEAAYALLAEQCQPLCSLELPDVFPCIYADSRHLLAY
jgi:hypothetical protein